MSTSLETQKISRAFDDTIPIHQMDIVKGQLWDCLTYQAGDRVNRHNADMFRLPISATKTLSETNLNQASRLNAPESFSISRILFTFNRDAADQDVFLIAEACVWSLWLGQKYYARCQMISMHQSEGATAPFRVCDFCRGVFVSREKCPNCGATQFRLTDVGEGCAALAGRQFFMDFPTPIVIGNQANFHVTLDCDELTVAHHLRLWCHLEGLHARGVQ